MLPHLRIARAMLSLLLRTIDSSRLLTFLPCARATSLVSPDPSGSVAAWATNERPVRSEVRSCDAAGVELPPYSVSVVSL